MFIKEVAKEHNALTLGSLSGGTVFTPYSPDPDDDRYYYMVLFSNLQDLRDATPYNHALVVDLEDGEALLMSESTPVIRVEATTQVVVDGLKS